MNISTIWISLHHRLFQQIPRLHFAPFGMTSGRHFASLLKKWIVRTVILTGGPLEVDWNGEIYSKKPCEANPYTSYPRRPGPGGSIGKGNHSI